MSRLSAVLVACAVLGATSLAHADACADQISRLKQAGRQSGIDPAAPVQGYAQLMFDSSLNEAQALHELGSERQCLEAVSRAKQMLEPEPD